MRQSGTKVKGGPPNFDRTGESNPLACILSIAAA
jgi:hypothetical protein